MKRMLIIFCCVSLISCKNKVICPAFQSTYILDDSTRNAYFSYVWQLDELTRSQFLIDQQVTIQPEPEEDTTVVNVEVVPQPPTDYYAYVGKKVVPWRIQKRTKYGIIKKTLHVIKKYQLRTAPMENLLAPEAIYNDFTDSLSVDSLSVAIGYLDTDSLTSQSIVTTEEKTRYLFGYDPADNFNVEQEYYNKYFADYLIDKRPNSDTLKTQNEPDSLQAKEPFLKDTLENNNNQEEQFDKIEEDGIQEEITEDNEEEERD